MEPQESVQSDPPEIPNPFPSMPDGQPDTLEHNVKMTSSEIAILWSSYLNDSMSMCILKHFLQHVDDVDARSILEHASSVSQGHLQSVTQFMNQENFPVPKGFSVDTDVNLSAPRLYSDAFYLAYLDGMSMIGMITYTAASGSATRSDLRKFYNACLDESVKLHNTCLDALLNKGLFPRPPFISTPDNVDFVDNRNYLTGFFGKRRMLNVVEITNLYLNARRNTLGKALIMGFAQVAQSQRVRQYMERGKNISTKHVKIFTNLLMQDDLPAPMTHDHEVTDSTEQTFSDKLLMFHIAALCAAGIGNYGVALGASPRRDLGFTFTRLQAEIALYAEDGAELMIDNAWLEEPPMADDRRQLARQH